MTINGNILDQTSIRLEYHDLVCGGVGIGNQDIVIRINEEMKKAWGADQHQHGEQNYPWESKMDRRRVSPSQTAIFPLDRKPRLLGKES